MHTTILDLGNPNGQSLMQAGGGCHIKHLGKKGGKRQIMFLCGTHCDLCYVAHSRQNQEQLTRSRVALPWTVGLPRNLCCFTSQINDGIYNPLSTFVYDGILSDNPPALTAPETVQKGVRTLHQAMALLERSYLGAVI